MYLCSDFLPGNRTVARSGPRGQGGRGAGGCSCIVQRLQSCVLGQVHSVPDTDPGLQPCRRRAALSAGHCQDTTGTYLPTHNPRQAHR